MSPTFRPATGLQRPASRWQRLATSAALLAVVAVLALPQAHAGQACEEKPPMMDTLARGLSLAHGTAQVLDRSGARVVLIARAGQDLSRHGLRWSHVGFAYRLPTPQSPMPRVPPPQADITAPNAAAPADDTPMPFDPPVAHGTWRIVHKLNECGQPTSGLYRQGLAQFFNDDPYRYEAALMPLKPEVAARLLPVLLDDTRVSLLHEPSYSLVAYPWSQRFQQSNQWAIETLAYAMQPSAVTRQRAQAWLMLNDYRPTTLNLHALERLGARMTRVNISFDDHPGEKRWSDRIETVGADSVLDWLTRNDLGQPLVVIR